LRKTEAGAGLEGPGGSPAWFIETSNEPLTITVREKTTGASYRVAEKGGVWTLTQLT
jgi:hypothetical protein